MKHEEFLDPMLISAHWILSPVITKASDQY